MEIEEKLKQLIEERKENLTINVENANKIIGCSHEISIKLVHLINTEDKIESVNGISEEVIEFNRRASEEWMNTVLEPFYKNVVTFLKLHPEYNVKELNIQSDLATGKGLLINDLKSIIGEMMIP